jgi:hypothetical protein
MRSSINVYGAGTGPASARVPGIVLECATDLRRAGSLPARNADSGDESGVPTEQTVLSSGAEASDEPGTLAFKFAVGTALGYVFDW